VNEIRQKYFISNLRTAVRGISFACQLCKNNRVKLEVPEMGQLPVHRLENTGYAFQNSGVDYFGPLFVTVKKSREKRYGVLFTCLSTRAVHLEVAHSLSTDACIMALERFTARKDVQLISTPTTGRILSAPTTSSRTFTRSSIKTE